MSHHLTVVDEQGVVVLCIDLSEYNLSKPLARESLVQEIEDAVDRDIRFKKEVLENDNKNSL